MDNQIVCKHCKINKYRRLKCKLNGNGCICVKYCSASKQWQNANTDKCPNFERISQDNK